MINFEDSIANEDTDKNNPCDEDVQEEAIGSGGQSSPEDKLAARTHGEYPLMNHHQGKLDFQLTYIIHALLLFMLLIYRCIKMQ